MSSVPFGRAVPKGFVISMSTRSASDDKKSSTAAALEVSLGLYAAWDVFPIGLQAVEACLAFLLTVSVQIWAGSKCNDASGSVHFKAYGAPNGTFGAE